MENGTPPLTNSSRISKVGFRAARFIYSSSSSSSNVPRWIEIFIWTRLEEKLPDMAMEWRGVDSRYSGRNVAPLHRQTIPPVKIECRQTCKKSLVIDLNYYNSQ